MKRFLAILKARNREYLRDRSALSWGFVFPILLMLFFAIAFTSQQDNLYKIGFLGEHQQDGFFNEKYLQFIPISSKTEGILKVERHQLDLLISPQEKQYWINQQSPRGYICEKILQSNEAKEFNKNLLDGREVRYIDWLLPGVLSMNMMFSALFGVGFVIVRYRKNGVLKRLCGTPLSVSEFLLAQIVSRLTLILFVSSIVYLICDFFLDFVMHGSYLLLLLVFACGALAMIALGLVIAARLVSDEVAGGVANAVSIPMMLLSGVWFSLDGAPDWVLSIAECLPLTHVVEAARLIMLEGAGLSQISYQIMIMLLMTVVFFVLGVRLFKWE